MILSNRLDCSCSACFNIEISLSRLSSSDRSLSAGAVLAAASINNAILRLISLIPMNFWDIESDIDSNCSAVVPLNPLHSYTCSGVKIGTASKVSARSGVPTSMLCSLLAW